MNNINQIKDKYHAACLRSILTDDLMKLFPIFVNTSASLDREKHHQHCFVYSKTRLAGYLVDNFVILHQWGICLIRKENWQQIVTSVNRAISRKLVFHQPPLAFQQVSDGCYGNLLSWFLFSKQF